MKRSGIVLIVATLFFASCVSQPEPSPAPATESQEAAGTNQEYKDRAVALVQGGSSTASGSSFSASSSSSATGSSATAAPAASPSNDQPAPSAGAPLTADEQAFLTNYLARLQYMVYYDEKAGIAPQLAKTAVTQANRYLIEKHGLSVIDFDKIEQNKKDQLTAYQAETGGSISIIQYIAQKNNADVYVELAFNVSSSTTGSRHYATAQGSMKIFETSTAQLLGAVAFQSPQSMDPNSLDAAVSNAITASVWTAMPRMMDQSKALIKGTLSRGVRYELVIQKTPDSRVISNLRRALARTIREVEQVSYSAEETKLNLYTFQNSTKVEDAIYDAAERSGMPDVYLVFSRGKAFTFNSGL
ncbi:MAG TPA: hypothetical protein DCG47_04670 [Spirochaetaceae bacterium]|jgi:hypothetical protein|nr:hypothetical protein [Spirochaetaceae bacterium]